MSKKRLLTSLMVGLTAAMSLVAQAADSVIVNGQEAHPTQILAKFKKGASTQTKGNVLSKAGLRVSYDSKSVSGLVSLDVVGGSSGKADNGIVSAAVLTSRIQELQQSGLFEYVEPNYIVHPRAVPSDEYFAIGRLWGLQNTGGAGIPGVDIDAVRAWDITTGSEDVVVAVIDTGVRYDHQDLRNRMWVNPGESGLDADGRPKETNGEDDDDDGYVDNVYGIDAFGDTGDPMDVEGHGTHVAGTIGAEANGGGPHVGVAWNVRIMALRFLGPNGGNMGDAIECMDFALAHGVKISNNSWGGGAYSQAFLDTLAAARAAGHLFIAAAGNDGSNNDAVPSYPDGYELDNVISVAAIDRANRLADFSNYGATKVDLAAPGVDILSSTSESTSAYSSYNGTSMAAPHVTGVAVLLQSKYPQASYIELRERMLGSVVPVPGLASRTVTGGRVSAYNALTLPEDDILEVAVTPPSGSLVVEGVQEIVTVSVSDFVAVRNATVTAITDSSTGLITFVDDGVLPDVEAGDAIYTALVDVPTGRPNMTLTITVEAPGKTTSVNTVNYTIVPPPQNDDFERASKIAVAGGVVNTVNRFATLQFGEPNHAGVTLGSRSLWWTWSPSVSSRVLVDTTGSLFDTVLAVYTGDRLTNLTSVVAVDDMGDKKQGYVYFNAVAGVTYRIAVSSSDLQSYGTVRLRLTPNGQPDSSAPVVTISTPTNGRVFTNESITVTGIAIDPQPNASGIRDVYIKTRSNPIARSVTGTTNWSAPVFLLEGVNTIEVTAVDFAGNVSTKRTISVSYIKMGPSNDAFVKALPLTDGFVDGDNELASKEIGEPDHADNQGGKSVWWSFEPAQTGVLFLSTEGSSFDTLLGLYTGNTVSNLTLVASNDDAEEGVSYSKLTHAVQAGQVYKIAVDGFAGSSGDISLAYTFTASDLANLNVAVNGEGSVTPGSGAFEQGSTVVLVAQPAPYHDFIGWEGDIVSSDNPLSVVLSADTSLTAVFAPRVITDDFETGNFSKIAWVNGLNSTPWVIRSDSAARGQFSASSGIIPNNGRSVLSLTVNLRAGLASFDYRVSSEEGWDFLEFYVNGVRQDRWSGETQWSSYVFPTTAGVNTLEWHYVKDSSNKMGADAGFIDNVDLPLGLLLGGGAALSINPASVDGGVAIRLNGESGQTYIIQASSDLVNWTSISTNTAVNGVINFVDQDAGNDSARFYRAVLP